ncbi:hypothetical protein ACHAXS_007415 [Conticribra weissflogii]
MDCRRRPHPKGAASCSVQPSMKCIVSLIVINIFALPHATAFLSPAGQARHSLSTRTITEFKPVNTRPKPPRFSHQQHERSQRRRWRLQAQPSDNDTSSPALSPSSKSKPTSSLKEILILVFPLLLVYISNQWSRASIYYLVDFATDAATNDPASKAVSAYEAMNIDLQFTQSQYGVLASTAFTVLFALSSLIAGNLADKYNRKVLTLASCAIWTVATITQGQAQSYDQVLAARIIMGGACAFCVPAAYSLIAEKISKDKAALANSIYGSGVYLGGGLASLSILLDENTGWRDTLEVIGLFGVLSVVVSGLLLPSDGDRDVKLETEGALDLELDKKGNSPAMIGDTLQILSIPRVRYLFLASLFRFSSGLMIGVWKAPYFKEAFADDAATFAVLNAFVVGLMGLSSGIVGGYIADWVGGWISEAKKQGNDSASSISLALQNIFDEKTVRLLIPIVGSILAIPTWYLTTHTGKGDNAFQFAMFWLSLEYLVAECWFGPTIAVLQTSVGTSKTGTAQGIFVLTGAVGNVAPTILGLLYGNQVANLPSTTSSNEVLADLLGWGVCAGYFLSAIFFAVSVFASGESDAIPGKK